MKLEELERTKSKAAPVAEVSDDAGHVFTPSRVLPDFCKMCGVTEEFHHDEEAETSVDGEFCEGGTEETIEEDLTTALDLLEQSLLMMEQITVKGGKVVRVPRGIGDLLEEIAEFLDKWTTAEEMRSDKIT